MLSSSLPAQHVQRYYERMLTLPQIVHQASAMHSEYRDDLISVYHRGCKGGVRKLTPLPCHLGRF